MDRYDEWSAEQLIRELRAARLKDRVTELLLTDNSLDEPEEAESICSIIHSSSSKFTRVAILKPYRNSRAPMDAPLDDRIERLGIIGQRGFGDTNIHATFPITKGISGLAYRTCQTAVENNVNQSPHFYKLPNDTMPVESIICTPICTEGKVRYILNIESTLPAAFDTVEEGVLKATTGRLEAWYDHIDTMERDHLSRLFNRNRFARIYDSYIEHAEKNHEPLGLILLDINHLKQVNDRYGHPAGDRYIAAVARGMRNTIDRRDDIAFRLGGDELAILLPATSLNGVTQLEAELRLNVNREVRKEQRNLLEVKFPESAVSVGSGEYLDFLTRHAKSSFFDYIDNKQYQDKLGKSGSISPAS